jgi:hypothetical protein
MEYLDVDDLAMTVIEDTLEGSTHDAVDTLVAIGIRLRTDF